MRAQSRQGVVASWFILCLLASDQAFNAMSSPFFKPVPYTAPSWCPEGILKTPKHGRIHLANLPTPLYRIHFATSKKEEASPLASLLNDRCLNLFVKRDDASGSVEVGGNKIRKLEFLLADAISESYDSVVTIGGEQSNHCWATAAAACMMGLEPHLILRTRDKTDQDLGLTGNLLVDRMVGAQIYTCTPGEYGRIGSKALVKQLCAYLAMEQDCRPYPIPVGGSNGLGSWGYINGVEEMLIQWNELEGKPALDHIVFACGSGGTAAGIALGIFLAFSGMTHQKFPMVHAVGVCDDENYFYNCVAKIIDEMGFQDSSGRFACTEEFVRANMIVHQGKGLGYAVSTSEELDFVMKLARETGIVLDPVYSGKALYNFFKYIQSHDVIRNENILFWHTGGMLGLFDKCDEMESTLRKVSPCHRLDVYGTNLIRKDVTSST